MIGKLLFLISVCMFIEIGFCGNSNEHVHIKLHVPEIIRRHTHVRTVYKHHPKSPKLHKPKKGPHHHHDGKFKHSKYETAESRPIWIPKAPHFKPKAKEETIPINEWQHQVAIHPLKKPKQSKKNPYALMIAEAAEDDDSYKAKLYKQYKQLQQEKKRKNQHMTPDYMDASLSFGQDKDDSEDSHDIYASPSSDHFLNPQLVKITEAHIRTKTKPHVPQWDYDSSSQDVSFYRKPHEWPMVDPSSVPYQYTTLAPMHLSSNFEDEEFMPSALLQETKYSPFDEYPTDLFQANKPKQMDLPYTYTKYKNRQSMKNAMSNLNTRVN